MGTGTPNHGVPQLDRCKFTKATIGERSLGSDIFQPYFDPSLAEIQRLAVVTGPNGGKLCLRIPQPANGATSSKATTITLTRLSYTPLHCLPRSMQGEISDAMSKHVP